VLIALIGLATNVIIQHGQKASKIVIAYVISYHVGRVQLYVEDSSIYCLSFCPFNNTMTSANVDVIPVMNFDELKRGLQSR
jgi:hypothetical protein